MEKKIVFFDGDGTLWYPKTTLRSVKPWWIYNDPLIGQNYLEHLILDPEAKPMLRHLKNAGATAIILSTVPNHVKHPQNILAFKIKHFGIGNLLDGYFATPEFPEAKGQTMLKILKEIGLMASDALMVGDSFKWDYLSARDVGIDAILLDCPYHDREMKAQKICSLSNLLNIL